MKQSTVWKNTKLGGYSGLKFTAKQVAKHVPICKIYHECMAGMGSVAKEVNHSISILNDKSEFCYQYLRKNFPNAVIRDLPFEHSLEAYDSERTFHLIDPPWRPMIYENNSKAYYDRTPIEYIKTILEIVPKLKGNWIICNSADEHDIKGLLTKSGYCKKIVSSDKKVIFGKYARTLLVSNMELNSNG